ncbi:MAG: 4-hydroxy-tetrahydrodipicolinate reductase [Steroidobacteraceae bacterium]
MAALALVVFGITGRMGQCVLRAVRDGHQFRLSGALASATSSRLGQEAAAQGEPSGVIITADCAAALQGASVAVDFSSGAAVGTHARACAKVGVPILIGATGIDEPTHAELLSAAQEIAVLIAPNTSVGVAVLHKLVAAATAGLGSAFEVEIAEAHHRMKRDAPSGTALSLGELIAAERGQHLSEVAVYARHGVGAPRNPSGIGFSVLRAGDIVGEHTVTFAGQGERLEITHRASDRMIFARGALQAAAWLVGRPAGLYGMQDVLGI